MKNLVLMAIVFGSLASRAAIVENCETPDKNYRVVIRTDEDGMNGEIFLQQRNSKLKKLNSYSVGYQESETHSYRDTETDGAKFNLEFQKGKSTSFSALIDYESTAVPIRYDSGVQCR